MTEVPDYESQPDRDSRRELQLEARARELDLIQTLGRRAAEAQTPSELFAATVAVLQLGEPLDIAMIASELDGAPEIAAYLLRPFDPGCFDRLVEKAAELLGWSDARRRDVRLSKCDSEDFHPALGPRRTFQENELIVLPILRRSRPIACLLFLPAGEAHEGQLRLLYSAANQLGVHLDRIVTAREAEAHRFRSILDSMPQAVVLLDDALQVVQQNRAGTELLRRLDLPETGTLEPGLRGLGLFPIIDRVRVVGESLAEGELSVDDELTFAVTVSPFAGAGGAARGLLLVLTDVSESRRLQRRLAQSEKMSSLGQLISGTAHELNNPLASVLGYAQLLRASAGDDPTLARRVDVLHREAERCKKIVGNLLAFARQRAPERKLLSLTEIVDSALSLLHYQLRVEGVRVERDLPPDLPPVHGDAHQLQQVMINLLTNAKDAIRESREEGKIRVHAASIDGIVELSVSDDGPGISAELRSRIFDPFYTTKAEGKGTGLGLSIVFGIVESHGGVIEALSSEGGGACFRIRLPVAAEGSQGRPELPRSSTAVPSRNGRVLVVEDEVAVAQMICEALAQDGHRAEAVGDGRQALRHLSSASYDAIVADLKMPGMGAEQLYEEIRRHHRDLSSRVLLTTGDAVSDEPERFVQRTGVELLRKPFDLDQLRRRIQRMIDAKDA